MAGKADIINSMAEKAGISKKEAEAAYDAFVEHLTNACLEESRCAVPGLGIFSVSERAARTGRNPKTSEAIEIPASRAVKFKAGKDLKTSINAKRVKK
jgi:DNA-binding protein HU-beta